MLLRSLQWLGADGEVATLLGRDLAAQVSLGDPGGIARLLDGLREAGADSQLAALAARMVAEVHVSGPWLLLEKLQGIGAARALGNLLPAAGFFKEFLLASGTRKQFQFGREPDGSPAAEWGWEDLP
jgi:hypothetical protein